MDMGCVTRKEDPTHPEADRQHGRGHDRTNPELLKQIGTPVTGYLYNAAPLSYEMTLTEGSLRDMLGDSQPTKPASGLL